MTFRGQTTERGVPSESGQNDCSELPMMIIEHHRDDRGEQCTEHQIIINLSSLYCEFVRLIFLWLGGLITRAQETREKRSMKMILVSAFPSLSVLNIELLTLNECSNCRLSEPTAPARLRQFCVVYIDSSIPKKKQQTNSRWVQRSTVLSSWRCCRCFQVVVVVDAGFNPNRACVWLSCYVCSLARNSLQESIAIRRVFAAGALGRR